MKKLITLAVIVLAIGFTDHAKAQVRVGVNINIGAQPEWGPAGYDYAEYYYFPDIDVYYSIVDRQYVFFDDGRWMFSYSLPFRCRDYDLYRGYKVVINEPRPYLRADFYRSQYGGYRGWYGRQEIIRDHHNEWRPERGWAERREMYERREERHEDHREGWNNRGGDWNRGRERGDMHEQHGNDRGWGHRRDRG